nr:DUF58 domain-containing protein [Candidatus Gracilibacteria bacterium]
MDYLSKFKKLDLKTKKMISGNLAGNFKSVFRGRGLEFDEFKEYEEGEDSKYIDWLVSAREQRLLTKKFVVDKSIKVFFVIDKTKSMDFGFDKKKIDTLIEVFFLLALSSEENSDEVGSLIFDENSMKFFDTKKGKAHIFEIYKNIVENLFEKEKNGNIKVTKKVIKVIKNGLIISKNKISGFYGKGKNYNEGKGNILNSTFSFLNKIKLKNTLLFILSDKMETLDDKNLKILALKNDIIFVNIFDNFENTLESNETEGVLGFLSNLGNKIFIDNTTDEKKDEYKKLREKKIKDFSIYLNRMGISYLKIDNLTNIYKEFFNFFNKK